MKRLLASLGLAALLSGPALVTTASAQPYPPVPAPRYEVIPARPGAHYVWQRGHWRWTGAQYVWVPGRWLVRQPHWHAWVPPHWRRDRFGRWIWVPGHWR